MISLPRFESIIIITMTFTFADQVIYFVDEDGPAKYQPKFFNLTSSTVGVFPQQSVHAVSMVIDAASIYVSNSNGK